MEDQEIEPEAGVRASAIDEGIEEQTEDGLEESEKHDRASWQVGYSGSAGPFGGRISLNPTDGPVVWISPLGAVHMATRAVRSPTMGRLRGADPI